MSDTVQNLQERIEQLEKFIKNLPIKRKGDRVIIEAHELKVIDLAGQTKIWLHAFTAEKFRKENEPQAGAVHIYGSQNCIRRMAI